MRGPKPKPTALRLLEGNPGRRPINPYEPKPAAAVAIEPPTDLPEEGAKIWRALSAELARVGLLTQLDLHALHRYCHFLLEYLDAQKKIDGKLLVTTKWPDGSVRQVLPNPFLAVRNQAAKNLNTLEQSLGLTPSARARMIGLAHGVVRADADPYGD